MKYFSKIISVLLAVFMSVGTAVFSASAVESSLKLNHVRSAVQIGSTVLLTASDNENVRWQSDNEAVAAVDQTGRVTGLSMGEATITASLPTGEQASCTVTSGFYTGIDVSSFNGDYTDGMDKPVNWEKVKAQGIDFVMIRAGYGWEDYPNQNDNRFVENVKGAVENGIAFGIYFYSYAETTADAEAEAAYFIKEAKEYIPDYIDKMALPVAYDLEEPNMYTMPAQQLTDIALTFSSALKKEGFAPMVYGNGAIFANMQLERLQAESVGLWYAMWPETPDFSSHVTINDTGIVPDIWQYRSDGSVPGATGSSGQTDMNAIYMLSSFKDSIAPPTVTKAEADKKNGTVEITWSQTKNAKTYTVYRAPVKADGKPDEENAVYLGKVGADTRVYRDETVQLDKKYFYHVNAQVCGDMLNPEYLVSIGGFKVGRSVVTPKLEYKLGDVDLNGTITVNDALTLQKFLAKMISLTPLQRAAGDVDGDGKITTTDVILIQRYLAKEIEF